MDEERRERREGRKVEREGGSEGGKERRIVALSIIVKGLPRTYFT